MHLFVKYWQDFLTSLQFLTIIPVPARWLRKSDTPLVQTGALVFYPLVGVIIGLLLISLNSLLGSLSSLLLSVLLLTAWVLVTGALHLDGLADSADAWLGGHGDRDRTMLILKDTHSGVAAIVALILLLLLKLACLNEIDDDFFLALLFAPVIARAAVVGLLITTDYVRENGIASEMMTSLPKKEISAVIFFVSLILVAIMAWDGVLIIISVIIALLVFRHMLTRRIGGTTGDTAGALVELIELLILFDFIIIEQFL